MSTIPEALQSLRPGAQWTLYGDDLAGIVWHSDGEPPTAAEVAAEVARLAQQSNAQAAALAEAQSSAIAHAKSLGFTDAMISAMYPALVTP